MDMILTAQSRFEAEACPRITAKGNGMSSLGYHDHPIRRERRRTGRKVMALAFAAVLAGIWMVMP